MSVYCQFGGLAFTISSGLNAIEMEHGYDYATYELAEGLPALAATGKKLSRITLKITLNQITAALRIAGQAGAPSDFATTFGGITEARLLQQENGVQAQIKRLYDTLDAGTDRLLMIGDFYQGRFVLTSIRDSYQKIINNQIIHYEATLELLQYAPRTLITLRQIEQKTAQQRKKKPRRQSIKVVEKPQKDRLVLNEIKRYNNPTDNTYVHKRYIP